MLVSVAVAVAIVIVIVPVAFGMPTVVVFIPPLVFVGIAIFAGFAEFVAGVLGLFAFPAVVAGGLMELVIGFSEAAPAGAFVGAESGCA
jgi:hypothetical protein